VLLDFGPAQALWHSPAQVRPPLAQRRADPVVLAVPVYEANTSTVSLTAVPRGSDSLPDRRQDRAAQDPCKLSPALDEDVVAVLLRLHSRRLGRLAADEALGSLGEE
jgi:hypothetical protein